MQERHLYEYAVIRFVPKVEREEFINMGIVLFSKQAKYLKSLYTIDENKLKLFSSELDMNCLKEGLQVFDKICMGNKEGGAIANMDIPDRFRWLTALLPRNAQLFEHYRLAGSSHQSALSRQCGRQGQICVHAE